MIVMERKLDLILGYECNSYCIFCYAAAKRGKIKSLTTEEAKTKMHEALERGVSIIDFNGGEPTIRKDIINLVRYAKKLGFSQIAITTNGQMFSYYNFAKKMIDAGLDHVVVSIHGHTSILHDIHTRVSGSFQKLVKGIRNLRKIKPDIYICSNTVITKFNYKFIPKIAENNITNLKVNALEFIFPHPRGNAWKFFDIIVPTLTEIAPFIFPTIKIGKKNNIEHIYFRYLPLCYMPGLSNYSSELVEKKFLKEEHVGPEFENLAVEEGRMISGRVKGPQCQVCKYNSLCEGIWKEYTKKRGMEELIPI